MMTPSQRQISDMSAYMADLIEGKLEHKNTLCLEHQLTVVMSTYQISSYTISLDAVDLQMPDAVFHILP